MRGKWLLVSILLLGLMLGAVVGLSMAQDAQSEGDAVPQALVGTAFTYQGRLNKGGSPVTDQCDFKFSLHDAPSGGNPVGSTQTIPGVAVTDGLFTVALNSGNEFGAGAFTGEGRWLAIEVQCTGDGSYTALEPRQELTPAPYALALPGLRTEQNATSPNVIGGYGGNSVAAGVIGATIGGGGDSTWPHQVTAQFVTVGGGLGNTASEWGATVGGGGGNTASQKQATVGGGAGNTASDFSATVGGGLFNTASGVYATVPGGYQAAASHHGELAFASGHFAASGDAQTSVYVLRGTSTGSGWTELYLDGSSQRITIAEGRTVMYDMLVVGRSDGGESVGFARWGVLENVAGVTSWVGKWFPWSAADDGLWEILISADDNLDALTVWIHGNGETIRWVATVRTVEVSW